MKCKSGFLFCMLLGSIIAFTSCVKDSEIGQEDSAEISSTITSDLIMISSDASSFIDESTQQERMTRVDTTTLELMGSGLLSGEMLKTDLNMHFKNSLDRDFKIDFEFLNDKDELKFIFQIPVSSGSKQKPTIVETSVIIETPELTTFLEATKLVYKIMLLPNDEPLLPDSEGNLELISTTTYYFDH